MIEFYYCVPFLLKIASPDFFCLVSGDGGPRKNSEAVQDHNVSGNQSSPVISMFKGDYLHFDIICHPHQCKEICLQTNILCPVFAVFQQELDTKHDKYERLVKISRDITIESKRTIFLLHRVTW